MCRPDAQTVGAGGLVVRSGVAGHPPGDLGELPDGRQQRAACLFGERATPVHPYRRIKLPERGPDEVLPGDHIVGEPQGVHPGRQVNSRAGSDASSSTFGPRGNLLGLAEQILQDGVGSALPTGLPVAEQVGLVQVEHPAVQDTVGVGGQVLARLPVLDHADQGLTIGQCDVPGCGLSKLLGHLPLGPQSPAPALT